MRKLSLLAFICIVTPLAAYAGKALGWWTFVHDWDVLAHSILSLGLALRIALTLEKFGVVPSYLNIVVPVVLIGLTWEAGQFLFALEKSYISNLETARDLAMDIIGALIGVVTIKSKRG